jgi:hypothetical protein
MRLADEAYGYVCEVIVVQGALAVPAEEPEHGETTGAAVALRGA